MMTSISRDLAAEAHQKTVDCINTAMESLIELDEVLQSMPENDAARKALIPAFARVAELSRVVRRAS